MRGMTTSAIRRSGSALVHNAKAASPSAASVTEKPSCSSAARISERTISSSSTMISEVGGCSVDGSICVGDQGLKRLDHGRDFGLEHVEHGIRGLGTRLADE